MSAHQTRDDRPKAASTAPRTQTVLTAAFMMIRAFSMDEGVTRVAQIPE